MEEPVGCAPDKGIAESPFPDRTIHDRTAASDGLEHDTIPAEGKVQGFILSCEIREQVRHQPTGLVTR